ARDSGDLIGVAEFVLSHARRIEQVARLETPLDALRADPSSLGRALVLGDLVGPQRRFVWVLLLAWELLDAGRIEDASAAVRHTGAMPKLDADSEVLAALPLAHALRIDESL